MSPSDRELAASFEAIAVEAGHAILEIYARDFDVRAKADASPVTEADLAAERIIIERLDALTPDIPVVGEEMTAAGRAPDIHGDTFWLVDPLDGTKEFVSRNGEFTVNIALIREARPALGVVHVPARELSFCAAGPGQVTRRAAASEPEAIVCRPLPADGAVVLASRSHMTPETEAWLDGVPVQSLTQAGSSLKFCLLAAGEADLYPRLGRTMEWDTAAGHAGPGGRRRQRQHARRPSADLRQARLRKPALHRPRPLARLSSPGHGLRGAVAPTGQERRAARCGASGKRLDAPLSARQLRPEGRAQARARGAEGLDRSAATLFGPYLVGLFLANRIAWTRRRP